MIFEYDYNLIDYNKHNLNNFFNMYCYGDKFEFDNTIIHSSDDVITKYLIDNLLKKIYGEKNIVTKNIVYNITGYCNNKSKLTLQQSYNHIILEPSNNSTDRYLLQDIIKNYSKNDNIECYNKHNYKIIIIDKIDKLSSMCQLYIKNTIDKYSSVCKFILISEKLSKVHCSLLERSVVYKQLLLSRHELINYIICTCDKLNINISLKKLDKIIKISNHKINLAYMLILLLGNTGTVNNFSYTRTIRKIFELIVNSIETSEYSKILSNIKKINELYYILFITNIPVIFITKELMILLISIYKCNKIKYSIVNITTKYEKRITKGMRVITHFEAYIIELIYELSHNI